MSYTLFLLLNVNHEKDDLLDYIGAKLEKNGVNSFCIDKPPDIFFTVDYLHEENDTSLCIDIPFGSEEVVLKEVFDFMTYLEEKIQFQVWDPQLGRKLRSSDTKEIAHQWRTSNRQALNNYSDGYHFLRNIEIREGKKVLVEAIRFKEQTWQNYCSVALAYSRIGDMEKACRYFGKAQELDPLNSGILHALSVTYFNLKNYQNAKDTLILALQADPENHAAQNLLQDCELRLKSTNQND